jgi:hypothetical protein
VQLNLPVVEDEPEARAPESAEVTEFPVVYAEEQAETDASEADDLAASVDAPNNLEDDIEPIVATEWPAPDANPAVLTAADTSQYREDGEADEDGEDAESSLTSA